MNPVAPPRPWKGACLLAIAGLHTVYAGVFFHQPLLELLQRGLFDSVGREARLGAPVWFVLAGALMAVLGLAVSGLERAGQAATLRQLGWALLALVLVSLVLMPRSGFWLVLAVAVALVWRPQLASKDR
jgi:hypothetical protein